MIYPQPALLTLYGDYARGSNGEIGIGSIVKLLGNFGLSEQSIRSAVSRMCHANLLKVRKVGRKSYYSLTEDGRNLLTKSGQRIFWPKGIPWDSSWMIVTYSIPEQKRKARDRLRTELSWMGCGALSDATWISPYDITKEVEELVERLKIRNNVHIFHAKHLGFSDPKEIVSRSWNLNKTHEKYASFLTRYRPKLEALQKIIRSGKDIKPSECFVERFSIIHEYRKLPFFDPDLPKELLPSKWLRPEANTLFREYLELVTHKAKEYFNLVISKY
ncbi:MAG: phenylacetic acid degradation operon negative regulatory protein PaaX [Deltaproteobacteria bacterium]|nr:phenylacetic acid degradation operon negative regulatory protein PaaX [Deltaproteobacteria bacterium]